MEGLQLLTFSNDGRCVEVNHDALATITNSVDDHPVAVVSIVGAYRRGKSFLLNFLIKYLKAKGASTWLGEPHSQLQGFKWRHDMNRVTTGILVWPEVFVINEVAVLLIDTQGTFDNVTTMQESTAIVAISVLLSSLTILNLSDQIESKDLDNLSYFLEYGRLAYEQSNTNQRPFQQLMFLIRDWKYDDKHAFGYEGGQNYLESILAAGQNSEELQNVKANLKASFQTTDCFLMPFPGGKVARDRNFVGKISDIAPLFITHLRTLVESVLSPQNLKPKLVGNLEVKVKDLSAFLHSLTKAFNNDELPTTTTLLQMFSETVARSIVRQAHSNYEAEMTTRMSKGNVLEQLDKVHETLKSEAIESLKKTIKLGGSTLIKMSCNDLAELIDESLKNHFHLLNEEFKNIKKVEENVKVEVAEFEKKKEMQNELTKQTVDISETINKQNLEEAELERDLQKSKKEAEEKRRAYELKKIKLEEKKLLTNQQEEEAKTLQEKLKQSELQKKGTIDFFQKICDLLKNQISLNRPMSMRDLHASILNQFTDGRLTGDTGDILTSYADAMKLLDVNDPRKVFIDTMSQHAKQFGVSKQPNVVSAQLQEFLQMIEQIMSGLQ